MTQIKKAGIDPKTESLQPSSCHNEHQHFLNYYYPDVHDPVDGDAHAADRRVGEHEVGKAAVADAKSPLIHLKSCHPFEDLGQCQTCHQLEGKS